MVAKCANPGCPAIFRYLHEGRLFLLEATAKRQLRYYWLCSSCSLAMTVIPQQDGEAIEIVPQQAPRECSAWFAA